MITEQQLKEIKERRYAATKGPYHVCELNKAVIRTTDDTQVGSAPALYQGEGSGGHSITPYNRISSGETTGRDDHETVSHELLLRDEIKAMQDRLPPAVRAITIKPFKMEYIPVEPPVPLITPDPYEAIHDDTITAQNLASTSIPSPRKPVQVTEPCSVCRRMVEHDEDAQRINEVVCKECLEKSLLENRLRHLIATNEVIVRDKDA